MKALLLLSLAHLAVFSSAKTDGSWGGWSEWSGWARGLCSGNQRVRTRGCTSPIPSEDGEYCDGDNAQQEDASVDGGWTEWSQWSICTKPCGGSKVNRTRTCTEPSPQHGGKKCEGTDVQFTQECLEPCQAGRVDGGWTNWSPWSACPSRCSKDGGAPITRHRTCDMPPPQHGGFNCVGNETDTIIGCFNSCPRDGGFGDWSEWSTCTKTCGTGSQNRQRFCNDPEPKGGKNCTGTWTETQNCATWSCTAPNNGGWSAWSSYSACSESLYCSKGKKKRTRLCNNPPPSNGGNLCEGSSNEEVSCPTEKCVEYKPNLRPEVPAEEDSYIARECKVKTKFTGNGANKDKVPAEVYSKLNFMEVQLRGGYFAINTDLEEGITKFCFEPLPAVSIKTVVDKLIGSYRKSYEMSGYKKPTDENQAILGFSIRVENKSPYKVKGYDFGIQKVAKFCPGNSIELTDVMFTYYTEGSYWGFLAKGIYTVSKQPFDTVVFRNSSSEKTIMVGTASKVKLGSLVPLEKLPSFAQKALKAIKVLDITFDKLQLGREVKKMIMRITVTFDADGVPLYLELLKGYGFKFSIGLSFDSASYQAVLEKISGASASFGGFLQKVGLEVELGISIAPMSGGFLVEDITGYSKEPLKSACVGSVPEGLLLVGAVGLPKDCGESSFCTICKIILGPSVQFKLITVLKKNYFKITAGFYNIKLTGNVYFSKIILMLEKNFTDKANPLSMIGFRAELKIPVNSGEIVVDGIVSPSYLYVGGLIQYSLGSIDIKGDLYMRGMWRKAFGLSWLAIGNIDLGLTITIGSEEPVTGFRLGGQLEFGKNCIYDADYGEFGRCLRIQVYFGIGKPTYFYGKISSLTIGKIVRMAGGGALPKPLAESGFPDGLMISYSPLKSVDLRVMGGPYIYEGFRFKGKLDLFGYHIFAEIRYSTTQIYIDTWIDPISLGNVIVIRRNKESKDLGPRFFFHWKYDPNSFIKIPYFKCIIEGYTDIFGIETGLVLNITMEAFKLHVYGNAWGLIYADLFVAAGYSYKSIKDSFFYVRVIVDLKGLTDAIDDARKAVQSAFDYARKKLREAVDKVKREKQKCKDLMTLKCNRCHDLKCKQAENNCKGFLDKAGKWIGGAINAVGKWVQNTAKKIRDGLAKVGKGIKSFFHGWRRRRSIIWKRNEVFELHIRDRRFLSKLLCEGLVGGGCRGVSNLCYGSCKAVEYIGKGLCNVLDIAVAALKVTETVCGWVNAAVQFLLQIFLIHSIRFELGLGKKFAGGFMVAAEIDLTLFAQRFHFGFTFDLKNKWKSISSAKDSTLDKYKKGIKPDREETTYQPYDPPNPFSDFDLSGTFEIEASSTAQEDRSGACIASNSKNSNDRLILKACNSTDEQQQWTYTFKGQLLNKFSEKCLDMSGDYNDYITQKDCNDHVDAQRVECDITTRNMKRRRSEFCISASLKATPNGPGYLTHIGSLKCVSIHSGVLVLSSSCTDNEEIFEINDDGHLVQEKTSLCVRAQGGNAVAGSALELVKTGCDKFTFTTKGSVQQLPTRLCVQTAKHEMHPSDNTELFLGSQCEYVQGSTSGSPFADPQMSFAFVPGDRYLKLDDCGFFYEHRTQQRFQINMESLLTVCAKFSPNIAMFKPATQSSVMKNGFPSRAVDGNFKFFWRDGSCTRTKEETDPWWRVDLEKEYIVTDVTIINRGEKGDRLKNFEVRIGNEADSRTNPICMDRVRFASDGEAVRLQCNPPIPGRYVKVQMYGTGILTLCEVIVGSRLGGLANLCLLQNGGCDQLCHNLCDKKVKCGCYSGFTLAYDQKTCVDIDECKINNGGCLRSKHATCVNFPGSYYCQCDHGYILKDNSLTDCQDINECNVKNGGCEQMCNNTKGGYLCTCRKGYQRKPNDPFGCQDIDECADKNGGCSNKCINYEGSYMCTCPAGYRLHIDERTCEEIYCFVLSPPPYGSFSPEMCQKRFANIKIGTKCTFACNVGYEISSPSNAVTCQIDGTWNRENPSCEAVQCSQLAIPDNGGVIPSDCHTGRRTYGQRCVHYCKDGYSLRGPSTKYCQADKKWSTTASVQCVKIDYVPYINCPGNIKLDLPDDASTLQLKYHWPTLQTNMKIVKVVPPGAGPDYPFPVGLNTVTFYGENDKGVTKHCNLKIDVQDVTPPHIINCPSDILIRTTDFNKIVSWKEPTFTDNVAVASIQKPVRASGSIWTAGETMDLQYSATDKSGNTAYCNFKVTVKSLKCSEPKGKKGSVIKVVSPGQLYSVACGSSKTFYGPYGKVGGMVACKDGDFIFMNHTLENGTLPECVGFVPSTASALCPNGTQKFSSKNFFEEMEYYCVRCPPGMQYNFKSRECDICPIGYYKESEDEESCDFCPKEKSTLSPGRKSISDCIDKCKPGYYSRTGLDFYKTPCAKCPLGSYQDLSGQKECTGCPHGATTAQPGGSQRSDCQLHPTVNSILPSDAITVKAGSGMRVECLFMALPKPKVELILPQGAQGLNVSQYLVFDLDMDLLGVTFVIDEIPKTAAGNYACKVTNRVGTAEKQFTVSVQ